MVKKIALKETQAPYSLSLDESQLAEGPVILEREGQPVAAVIPIAEYERFRAWKEEQAWRRKHKEHLQALRAEREAFLRLKPQLLKTHKGLFVAIHHGEVVDCDADNQELAKRVMTRFKDEVVYIHEVSEEPRVLELPSPELVRNA